MKKLLISFMLLALPVFAQDNATASLTANTPVVLLSGRYAVDTIQLTANSGTNTTFKVYDSSSTNTNLVLAAYTQGLRYSTNYSTVVTNTDGFVYTNTFAGTYQTTYTVGASTNERPRILVVTVPAGGTSVRTFPFITANGLVVQADQTGAIVETTYKRNP